MHVGYKDENARTLALKEPRLVTDIKTSHYSLSEMTKLSPGHSGNNESGVPKSILREEREKGVGE